MERRAGGPGAHPGRRARTARSAAPLPVPPARRPRRRLRRRGPAGEPPPRDRGALLRPAGLHRLRADQRAGGGDVRAARVPHPARPPRARVRRDAGAVHRRRGDGVLQRPAALRGPGACAPYAWPSRCGRRRTPPPSGGPTAGTTSRSAPGSRRATRPWGGSATRAASTTPRSAASRTWRRGCATEAAPWQVLVSRQVHVAVQHEVDDVLVGDLQPRGFSSPVRVYDVRETHSDEVTR